MPHIVTGSKTNVFVRGSSGFQTIWRPRCVQGGESEVLFFSNAVCGVYQDVCMCVRVCLSRITPRAPYLLALLLLLCFLLMM